MFEATAVCEPTPPQSTSPAEQPPSMATSTSLLLNTSEKPLPVLEMDKSKNIVKTPTANLLETRSLSILRAFNERDVAAPYSLHATPDFLFIHEDPHGAPTAMKKHEAMYWMRHVILKNIEHFAEVMSSAVELDEKNGFAIVWVGIRIHDRPDGFWPGSEKVTMFFWKRVEGFGDERRWMWWKHVCLSARMPFPR